MTRPSGEAELRPVIVTVDDDPGVSRAVARDLRRRYGEGNRIVRAESGEQALEAVTSGDYDIVLMDVRMPGLGGLEATRTLRARGLKIPVVALTANAFEDDRRACIEAGMDDFLVKPLSLEALRGALARWTGAGWTPRRARAKLA